MISSLLAAGIVAASGTPALANNLNHNFTKNYVVTSGWDFKFDLPKTIAPVVFSSDQTEMYIVGYFIDYLNNIVSKEVDQQSAGSGFEFATQTIVHGFYGSEDITNLKVGDFVTQKPKSIKLIVSTIDLTVKVPFWHHFGSYSIMQWIPTTISMEG